MNYKLKNIIPKPIEETDFNKSEIWGNEIELQKGKNYIVKSASGKGKSTFISYCCGLRKDFKGELFFNKINSNQISHDQWVNYRKENISIVNQQLELIPFLTVWENLLLKNELTNYKAKEEIEIYLELLDIISLKNKRCNQLSIGQQQRTAIIRALLQPFDWLFMDEPFSHLDKENEEKASQLIQKISSEQNASIIITSLGNDHNFNNLELLKL